MFLIKTPISDSPKLRVSNENILKLIFILRKGRQKIWPHKINI